MSNIVPGTKLLGSLNLIRFSLIEIISSVIANPKTSPILIVSMVTGVSPSGSKSIGSTGLTKSPVH